jgi:hypothetical protein
MACHREGSEMVTGAEIGRGGTGDGSEASGSERGRGDGEEKGRGGRGAKVVLSP